MRKSMISKLAGMTFVTALAVTTAMAWAQDADDMMGGSGGRGMMGGGCGGGMGMMGSGMMGGHGGYGMGPGMMGGADGQMGMMGGMMGPGMMGGYGGMDMMGGGYGGMGMTGMGALENLDLSAEQRTKIKKILDEERKQHWAILGKMMDEQNKMRDLYEADEPDPKKVGAVYGQIAKLRQQMLETHVQASNQMQEVLTKEQREQWRQWNRGGWRGGPRGPAAGKPGTMGPGMMR